MLFVCCLSPVHALCCSPLSLWLSCAVTDGHVLLVCRLYLPQASCKPLTCEPATLVAPLGAKLATPDAQKTALKSGARIDYYYKDDVGYICKGEAYGLCIDKVRGGIAVEHDSTPLATHVCRAVVVGSFLNSLVIRAPAGATPARC